MKHSIKNVWMAGCVAVSFSALAQNNAATHTDDLVQLVTHQNNQTVLNQTQQSPQYVVQLGAFTHPEQALRWQEQLAQQGIEVVINQEKDEKGLIRVRSLPLPSKAQAQEMVLQLKLYGVPNALIMQVNE